MFKKNYLFWLFLILLVVFTRLEVFIQPVGTDEGIYFHIAQEIDKGHLPYRDVADHKEPLVLYWYALIFKFFGCSVFWQQFIETLFFILVAYLFYKLLRLFFRESTAQVLLTMFALAMNAHRIAQGGNQLELYLVFFNILALLTYFKLYRPTGRISYLCLCGILFGLGFISKTVALFSFAGFFLAVLSGELFFNKKRNVPKLFLDLTILGAGFFIPTTILFLIYHFQGILRDYLWVNYYFNYLHVSHSYMSPLRMREAFVEMIGDQLLSLSYLWLGLFGLLFLIAQRKLKLHKEFVFFIILALFESMACVLSFKFYGHYFMQLIPTLTVLTGYFWEGSKDRVRRILLGLIVLTLVFQTVFLAKYVYQSIYLRLPDGDKLAGEYIKARTTRTDKIYVNNLRSAVYFYADRSALLVWNHDNFMKSEKIIDEALRKIYDYRPKYIVINDSSASSERMEGWLNRNYKLVKTFASNKVWELRGIHR